MKLGLTKFGNEAKPQKYSLKKKSCISYQFRADVQTYGQRLWYRANKVTQETGVCTQKFQVAAALMHRWMCIEVVFFRILKWGCLIPNLSQNHFDSQRRCKDTSPTYSFLTINFCFGPPCHITNFGHGVLW